MTMVLDCSATLAWLHEDEESAAIDELFRQANREGAFVPRIWRYEVANGLTMALRRKRISVAFRDAALQGLIHLPITTDPESDDHAWTETVKIADLYGLSIYDASYLELAQRRRLSLASLDKMLNKAARAAGVRTLL